jgi:iron(III) transport system ATP-binding protein
VLEQGRVVARDDPRSLYRDPPDLLAAGSIGEANVLIGETHGARARCALGDIALRTNGHRQADGPARLLLRPEQLTLHLQVTAEAIRATVLELRYHGHDGLAHVVLDHPDRETVLARVSGELVLEPGQEVWVQASGPAHAWASQQPVSQRGK